jgi:hypothetical protein
MSESEGLKPFEQAANNIELTSWDREQRTPEFQQIEGGLEQLRKNIIERKSRWGQSQEGPLADMAYDASSALLNAVRTVLKGPEAAANPVEPANTYNQSRISLLQAMAEAMETLHITPEHLAATLKYRKDWQDSRAKEK